MHSWLEEFKASPDHLFPDLGGTLHSSTRQEMQCCMTPVRPKFLRQLLSFLPRNFIDSGGKIVKKD